MPNFSRMWRPGLSALCCLSALTFSAQAQSTVTPRPGEVTLQKQMRDPARAALLSLLYPGAGQFYVGNNPERSLWVLGGGTAIIAGSAIGYGVLADRPPESTTLGTVLITGVLLGYHLWNVRDAYNQADLYNKSVEERSRFGWDAERLTPQDLPALNASFHQQELVAASALSWSAVF